MRFLLGYHNPHSLVNFLPAIFNKFVTILNNLLKIKFIWLYKLAKLMVSWGGERVGWCVLGFLRLEIVIKSLFELFNRDILGPIFN
ncbi:hypothetical protein B9R42_20465 [Arthrospira platensis PCC 7345]